MNKLKKLLKIFLYIFGLTIALKAFVVKLVLTIIKKIKSLYDYIHKKK